MTRNFISLFRSLSFVITELKESLRRHLDTIELRKRQDEISRTADKQRELDKKFLFDRGTTYC